jgi:hypothetical protein
MKMGKSEADIAAEKLLKCRQIVAEILNFGVTQEQLLQIIYLLSLELENREALEDITDAVKSHKIDIENLGQNKNKLLEV